MQHAEGADVQKRAKVRRTKSSSPRTTMQSQTQRSKAKQSAALRGNKRGLVRGCPDNVSEGSGPAPRLHRGPVASGRTSPRFSSRRPNTIARCCYMWSLQRNGMQIFDQISLLESVPSPG